MKILSFNCNGIRSAIQKGLVDLIKQENPDVVCLQETKAKPEQCSPEIWQEMGYSGYYHTAEKNGYSSVAIFSRIPAQKVVYGIEDDFFDREGRSVGIDLGGIFLWNLYFPSGTSGEIRQAKKMEFLALFESRALALRKKYKKIIITGDVNIAHTVHDIHNPKGNEKNSGFLPEERDWLTGFLSDGWLDCYRFLNPDKVKYSWWTYRFQARSNNKGWRIDYFFASKNLASQIQSCDILTDFVASDHAPVILKIQL